jgi:hypothetical protein
MSGFNNMNDAQFLWVLTRDYDLCECGYDYERSEAAREVILDGSRIGHDDHCVVGQIERRIAAAREDAELVREGFDE